MSETNYQDIRSVINLIYESYNRAKPGLGKLPDRLVRHPNYTRLLLDAFGSPDKCGYNVAVTGSKGKGSHAILLAGMLQKLGLKVGLFTGPHLVNFMERFRVNGYPLGEGKFISLVHEVTEEVRKIHLSDTQYVGPVGIMAVIAARWFSNEQTDVNIFELGRGALHDDVNQIFHRGAVLAPVFLEHSLELGPTLEDVAREKAGVLCEGVEWLISHPQEPVVESALAATARTHNGDIEYLERDFTFRVGTTNNTSLIEVELASGSRVVIPIGAEFMKPNAAVALRAAERVLKDVQSPSKPNVSVDVSNLRLPGRLERLMDKPQVFVDGTIHAESARFVREFAMRELEMNRVRHFGAILSLPHDKDRVGVLSQLHDVVDWVVLTEAHNPYLHFSDAAYHEAKKWFSLVDTSNFIEDALNLAMPRLSEEDGLLLLGTQSFVGDVLRYFRKGPDSIWNS